MSYRYEIPTTVSRLVIVILTCVLVGSTLMTEPAGAAIDSKSDGVELDVAVGCAFHGGQIDIEVENNRKRDVALEWVLGDSGTSQTLGAGETFLFSQDRLHSYTDHFVEVRVDGDILYQRTVTVHYCPAFSDFSVTTTCEIVDGNREWNWQLTYTNPSRSDHWFRVQSHSDTWPEFNEVVMATRQGGQFTVSGSWGNRHDAAIAVSFLQSDRATKASADLVYRWSSDRPNVCSALEFSVTTQCERFPTIVTEVTNPTKSRRAVAIEVEGDLGPVLTIPPGGTDVDIRPVTQIQGFLEVRALEDGQWQDLIVLTNPCPRPKPLGSVGAKAL